MRVRVSVLYTLVVLDSRLTGLRRGSNQRRRSATATATATATAADEGHPSRRRYVRGEAYDVRAEEAKNRKNGEVEAGG